MIQLSLRTEAKTCSTLTAEKKGKKPLTTLGILLLKNSTQTGVRTVTAKTPELQTDGQAARSAD